MAFTINSTEILSDGSKKKILGSLAFDNSYANPAGEIITAAQLSLSEIESFSVSGNEGGYMFDPIVTTNGTQVAVHVYQSAGFTPAGTVTAPNFSGTTEPPPIISEEVVAVSTNVGTLAEQPTYVIAVEVTAGSTTGTFNAIPVGETPATTEVAVNFTTGALTFAAGDAVTSCRVTYAPSRRGTLFASPNLTEDETVTASASKVNLAARAALVQYVYDTTGGTFLTPIPPGEAPASGEVALDINDGGNTSIDTNADIDGNTLKVTYIAFSNLASPDMFIDDADITLSSEAWNFVSDGGIAQMVVPGFGTNLVGEAAAAANSFAQWGGPSATAADTVAQWQPALNTITTAQTAAMLTTAISWVVLAPNLQSGQDPAGTNSVPTFTGTPVAAAAGVEVTNGTDLSALNAVQVKAIGL